MIPTIIIMSAFIIFFVLCGIQLYKEKWTWCVTGFTRMLNISPDRYDLSEFCKFFSKMSYILAAGVLLWLISDLIANIILFFLSMTILTVTIVYLFIYVNNDYHRKK